MGRVAVEIADYTVTSRLRQYEGPAAWHFLPLPEAVADEIAERFAGAHRPFGSLPVRATIGATTWPTSLFADTRAATYLLPVKADVRRRERIEAGDVVTARLELGA